MDDLGSLDGFDRSEDLFGGFSELMNFDSSAGWCSPAAADQMFASFALSAGYEPYECSSFTELITGDFLSNDVAITQSSSNDSDFILPAADEDDGSLQQNQVQEAGNSIIPRSPRASLDEKMLKAMSLVKDSSEAGFLAQVWVPVRDGDKYILRTCGQPYLLDEMLAGYREVSAGFTFSAEVKPGLFPGLPGRVFVSKVPEWTSNVAHYRKGEFLRIDHALSHEVRGSIAVPIFEDGLCEKSCCAVLELVTLKEKSDFCAEMDHVCRALEAVNLKSAAPPRLYKQCLSKNQMAALADITDVLREVCHAHRLPIALTWIPCSYSEEADDEIIKVRVGGHTNTSTERRILCIEPDACYVNDSEMQGFVLACSEHHLEASQGVAGKALQSNYPFFFPDVKEYHIDDYPLVQHARKYGLTGAAAIRLRSAYSGDDDYILEFFLPVNMKGSTEQQLLLSNLSCTMQRICTTLRTVSDAELSGVAGPSVEFHNRLPLESLTTTDQVSVNQTESTDVLTGVPAPDQVVSGSRQQFERKNVSLSVLQQYFSGSLKDAAKAVGVCPTTLKRICRQYGISRWPSRKIKKVKHSLKKIQSVLESVHGAEGGLKFDPTTGGLVAASAIFQDLDVQKTSNLSINNPEGASTSQPPHPPPSSCFVNLKPSVQREGECYKAADQFKLSNSLPITTSVDECWSLVDGHMKAETSTACVLTQSLSSMANSANMDTCHTSMNDERDHIEPTPSGMTDSSAGSMLNGSSSTSPCFNGLKKAKSDTCRAEGSKLTVKASYKEDTVRFKLEATSSFFQLYEEVAKRFKIQTGSFQLKYMDDEDEWVLLVSESDWTECLEILEHHRNRCVKFLVCDAVFATGSSGSSNCFLMSSS